MSERPILFSGPMVQAILAGRKTQTRRQVKLRELREFQLSTTSGYDWRFRDRRSLWNVVSTERLMEMCPYGQAGDRLWVRETHGFLDPDFKPTVMTDRGHVQVTYQADHAIDPNHGDGPDRIRWRPSIHMPRWASRITLEVTSVSVERLQSLGEDDAQAEGIEPFSGRSNVGAFQALWDSINGNWAANPWVWAISFRVLP